MKCSLAFVVALVIGAGCGIKPKSAGENPPSLHINGGDLVDHFDRAYSVRLRLHHHSSLSVRFCGGARLDNYWIITAAECLDKRKYRRIQIMYPAKLPHYDYDVDEYSLHEPGRYVIHPDYNIVTGDNNIGLLACPFCIPLPDNISVPLTIPPLWEKYHSFSSLPAVVSGWTIDNRTTANQLERNITSFKTHIVNSFLCRIVYFFRSVKDQHICASSWLRKRITEADVGVPLVIRADKGSNAKMKLVGIASSIKPWSTIMPLPIIFTKITPYLDWISKQTRNK